jgi:hypothetical protein
VHQAVHLIMAQLMSKGVAREASPHHSGEGQMLRNRHPGYSTNSSIVIEDGYQVGTQLWKVQVNNDSNQLSTNRHMQIDD